MTPRIKVLTALTYYDPHWTGLTAIAKRVAEGLAARGHEVTVLTTRHVPELASDEVVEGVRVVRLRPIGQFSRGMVVPSFPLVSARMIGQHDVVHVHTPMPEAPLLALLARAQRRPLVMTHQGDLVMPAGLLNRAIERAGTVMLSVAGRLATVVCPLSADYASSSGFLRPFASKTVTIDPPVDIPMPDANASMAWRRQLGLADKRVIGFAGRFVEEKGFDFLLRAIPRLRRVDAGIHLVYAGEHDVAYENFYGRCMPLIEPHRDAVTFVGLLRDRQRLADFYAMCDVFALPSRTDMFGAVQVEAMLSGTPVVASDIPGAREPVSRTGMGELVEPKDPTALANGLLRVLSDMPRYVRSRSEIEAAYDPKVSIAAYEALMAGLVATERPH